MPPPPRTEHQSPQRLRVTNDLGVLTGGPSDRRTVTLVNQRNLRLLGSSGKFWEDLPQRALSIVLGLVDLRLDGKIYRAEVMSHEPGYGYMLRCIASDVARRDLIPFVDFSGKTAKAKAYGPAQGLTRRGSSARWRAMKDAGLDHHQAEEAMLALRRSYLSRLPRGSGSS